MRCRYGACWTRTSLHRGDASCLLRLRGFALVALVTPREVQVVTVSAEERAEGSGRSKRLRMNTVYEINHEIHLQMEKRTQLTGLYTSSLQLSVVLLLHCPRCLLGNLQLAPLRIPPAPSDLQGAAS